MSDVIKLMDDLSQSRRDLASSRRLVDKLRSALNGMRKSHLETCAEVYDRECGICNCGADEHNGLITALLQDDAEEIASRENPFLALEAEKAARAATVAELAALKAKIQERYEEEYEEQSQGGE